MACAPTKLLADSNRASLKEIIESNDFWACTPDTGTTRARRFTTSSLAVTKETATSEEIRDDRMVSSVIETSAQSGGEINWEFAAGTTDYDHQRVLMGAWSRPMDWDVFRGSIVSIKDADEVSIAGGDYTDYFVVGRRIKTSGFNTPANNDYMQVVSVAFTSGVTNVTISGATLVAEAGTSHTTVQDANDVVILKSTAIRFGSTAATIDSNGGNAFAAAVTAKQLVSGQRIFVEGVGYEVGSLALDTVVDADSVTISDGVNTYKFEAQSDSDIADADALLFTVGVDDASTAVNLAAKINALRPTGDLNLVATVATDTVTLTNLNKTGGVISDEAATITVVDFTGGVATLGGFYTIVSVTNDAIVVDRAVPTLAAGKKVTIKGSMLRNPGISSEITAQSASIETGFQDVGQFFLTKGLRAGGLSMDVSANAIVTGSTTVMGQETTRLSVSKLGNTTDYNVLDAAATEVVSATANVGALSINGVETTSAIQSIQTQIEGNLRAQMAVGNKFPVGIAAGRLNITGTITAYFADGSMYDRFLDHETVSLSYPIIDPDANTYYFTIPAFKLTSDPVAPGGTDQDVMETMEFTAFRDVATKCMMQIDRFSSTDPITSL